jgi:hypothetical protein
MDLKGIRYDCVDGGTVTVMTDLKMEAVCTSETLLSTYEFISRYVRED